MQSNRTARYIDVLKTPGVLPTFGTALIGRGAYALVFLPLLYAVSDTTGSVGLAGIAVGLYGAGPASSLQYAPGSSTALGRVES